MSSLRIIWRICFVDSSDSSRIKSDCGHHHRGVAPEGATRAATDRPVKDRKHPLYQCSGRTYLGNRLSPSSEGALTTSTYLASLVSSGKSRMLRFIQPCISF